MDCSSLAKYIYNWVLPSYRDKNVMCMNHKLKLFCQITSDVRNNPILLSTFMEFLILMKPTFNP
jgi:hypothetical protein